MPSTIPTQPPRANRIETMVALLDQRLVTAERTNERMLVAIEGLRSDLSAFMTKTVAEYTPRSYCDAMCARNDARMNTLTQERHNEMVAIRDAHDERLRLVEQGTAGLRGALPVIIATLSMLVAVGVGILNFAAKAH